MGHGIAPSGVISQTELNTLPANNETTASIFVRGRGGEEYKGPPS